MLPYRMRHLLLQHPLLLIVVFIRSTMQLITKLLFVDAKLID